jgi:hypothetical protein
MAEPIIWAGLRNDRDLHLSMLKALNLLSEDPARATLQLDWCEVLAGAAKPVGEDWSAAQARVPDLAIAMDAAEQRQKRRAEAESMQLSKLQAKAALAKPVEWKGKRYHRAELEGDEAGAKRAEQRNRERWARKVIGIMVEADLPFGQEFKARDWSVTSPEAGRCLRGLRAATLKKRAGDISPFLRYLRCSVGKPFPDELHDVLRYFAVRTEEGAARSVYRSLQLALK